MKYFGTDGIRGEANKTLTAELSFKLGQALSLLDSKVMVIATDTRASKDMLKCAIIAGALSMGIDVIDADIAPTPALIYYSQIKKITGIMVTASHNPYKDNGIKVLNKGVKLDESKELEIENFIDNDICNYNGEVGVITNIDIKIPYFEFLDEFVVKTNKKIAIDCANGATYQTAPMILKKACSNLVICANNPDGYNINRQVGSTHLDNLKEFVLENKWDYGFAFDGDGDRVLAVDNLGRIIDGDMLIYILGSYLYKNNKLNHNQIVFTCMSNLGMLKKLHEKNIKTSITPVGDKYVVKELLDNNYSVGGEASGHIIMPDILKTGDGVLIALYIIKVLEETNTSFDDYLNEIEYYPEVLINLKVQNKKAYLEEEVQNKIKEIKNIFKEDGKVFIRESGTEDLVRITVSCKKKDDMDKYSMELKNLILKYTKVVD